LHNDLLSSEEAARLLHLHVKRIQELARSGRIPGSRIGRKWLFRRGDIERALGTPTVPAGTGLELLSARNHLRGRITSIVTDGLMAEVRFDVGGQELTAVITRSSVERLGLAVGDPAYAVIKSTEVMVASVTRS
jgi:molybdopterin-binding protein